MADPFASFIPEAQDPFVSFIPESGESSPSKQFVGPVQPKPIANTLPGKFIQAAQPRTFLQRAQDVFTQGALGDLFDTHAPDKFKAALDKNRQDFVEKPLLKLSALDSPTEAKTITEGARKGLAEGLESWTSPQGVAMMASLGKLGKVGAAGRAAVAALGAGFDADMIIGAVEQVPEAKELWDKGQKGEAAKVAVKSLLTFGFGAYGAGHKGIELGKTTPIAERPLPPANESTVRERAEQIPGKELKRTAKEYPGPAQEVVRDVIAERKAKAIPADPFQSFVPEETATTQPQTARRTTVAVPEEGLSDAEQRAQDARNRIAAQFGVDAYEKLPDADRAVVDSLVKEGYVGAEPIHTQTPDEIPEPAKVAAETPAPLETKGKPTTTVPPEEDPEIKRRRDELANQFADVPYDQLEPEERAEVDRILEEDSAPPQTAKEVAVEEPPAPQPLPVESSPAVVPVVPEAAVVDDPRAVQQPVVSVLPETDGNPTVAEVEEKEKPIAVASDIGREKSTSSTGISTESDAARPNEENSTLLDPNQIIADPERFQFKSDAIGRGGTTDKLRDVTEWNPRVAGELTIWKDPKDGKWYVVNGHHRLELAKRLKVPNVKVNVIEALDAITARGIGALDNIQEGNGSAIDAAKVFRDLNLTDEDLQKRGIALKGVIAREAIGLRDLTPGVFDVVARGEFDSKNAATIGRMVKNPADQIAAAKLIERAESNGKSLKPSEVERLIKMAQGAERAVETQDTLFGEQSEEKNYAVEQAQLADWIARQIGKEERLFSTVGNANAAERLSSKGNVIKAAENQAVAEQAAQAAEIFEKMYDRSGPISDAVREGAGRIGKGENANDVRKETYERVHKAIAGIFGGEQRGRSEALGQVPESRPTEGSSGMDGREVPGDSSQPDTNRLQPIVSGASLFSLDRAEKAIESRIAQRWRDAGRTLSSGPGLAVEQLADYAALGAIKIAKGAVKFKDWSSDMLKDFGEDIRPHLGRIWLKARELSKAEPEAKAEPKVEEAKPVAKEVTAEKPKPTTSPSYDETKENILKNVSEPVRDSMDKRLADFEERNMDRKAVTFDEIREEARSLDPSIVDKLDVNRMKAGETLDPAVRYAARETLNGIQEEIQKRTDRLAKQGADMDPAKREGEQRKLDQLEKDARRLVDVLIPTRSQDGRNLAYHRMMAEKSFDVTYWLGRARKSLALPESAELPEKVRKTVETATTRGRKAETQAVEKVITKTVEKKVRTEAEQEAAKTAKDDARIAKKAEVDAAIARIKARLTLAGGSERGSFSNKPVDPVEGSMVDDLVTVGRFYIEEFGTKASEWRDKMVAEFGDGVKIHLKDVYDRSVQTAEPEETATRAEVVKERYKRLVSTLEGAIKNEQTAKVEPVSTAEKDAWEKEPEILALRAKLAEVRADKKRAAQVDPNREEVVAKALRDKISSLESAVNSARKVSVDAIKPEERKAFEDDPEVKKLRADLSEIKRDKAQAKGAAARDAVVEKTRKQFVDRLRKQAEGETANINPVRPEERAAWENDPEVLKLRARIAEDRAKTPKVLPDTAEKQARYKKQVLDKVAEKMAGIKKEKTPSKWELTPSERAQVDKDPEVRAARIALARQVANLEQHGWRDYLLSMRSAGLLTAAGTHVKNVASNLAFQAYSEAARVPAMIPDAILNATRRGAGRPTVQGPNIKAIVKASRDGAVEGYREAKEIWKTGETPDSGTDLVDISRELNARHLFEGKPVLKHFAWTVDAINYVFRSLKAEDRFTKRYAFTRSLEEQMKTDGVKKPTEEMMVQAWADADFQTFNNKNMAAEYLNRVLTQAEKSDSPAAKAGATVVKFFLPFRNTPANVWMRTFEGTGAGVITGAVKAMTHEGKLTPTQQRAISMEIGRGALGAGIVLTGFFLGKNGYVTGMTGRSDKGERDTNTAAGVQDGSVKIGDKWYSILGISPIGNLAVIGATLAKKYDKLRDLLTNPDDALAVAAATVKEQPMLRGLQDMVEAVEERSAGRVAASAAGSMVPSVVSEIGDMTDSARRDTKANTLPGKVVAGVKARIPALRETLPERVDLMGETIPQDRLASTLGFSSTRDKTTDAVLKQLVETSADVGMSPQKKTEDDAQYRARLKREGAGIRYSLGNLIRTSKYAAADKEGKAKLLKADISKMRAQIK